jgi:DNA-binding CsgD family transcriptional regulator
LQQPGGLLPWPNGLNPGATGNITASAPGVSWATLPPRKSAGPHPSASLPLLEFCRRAERIDTAANEKCCAWSPMAKTDKESAEELVISPRTANQHIAYIFLKIDVTSRAAAAYAIRNRLV